MTATRPWREFEQLVARIEAAAAPRGAVVRSPDRIRDLVTGRKREVDASIRYRIGTVDVLITIECRRRKRKGDDTWIEQLASKRNKVGAAKTIAVSEVGFSDSAHMTAKQAGIELRTVSDVTDKDLQTWFIPTGVVHVFRKIEEMECVVVLQKPDGTPDDCGCLVRDVFEEIFYHDKIHSPFPPATLWHLLEISNEERFRDVPFDGSLKEVTFALGSCGITARGTDDERIGVHRIQLSAMVGYESAVCETQDGEHVKYKTPDGSEIQRTTFDAELFGLPFEFEHQSNEHGQPQHAAFRVKQVASKDPDVPNK